jgi:Fic family protein
VFSEEGVQRLHSVAMNRLLDTPGQYRQCPVVITNAAHKPPNWLDVPGHMRTMCEYVNAHWDQADLIHLSSFVLWRLNWIHPFENGNGRTSRAASYMLLNIKHGRLLPSRNSIIEQIVNNRQPYYEALRAADEAHTAGQDPSVGLIPLQNLMTAMLKEQIKANF